MYILKYVWWGGYSDCQDECEATWGISEEDMRLLEAVRLLKIKPKLDTQEDLLRLANALGSG